MPPLDPHHCWVVPSVQQPAKGVVLIAHGINTKPEANEEIIRLLTMERGYDVVQLVLTGHVSGQYEEVSADIWSNDIVRGFRLASERAAGRPVEYIGHSLGGAAAIKAVREHPEIHFSRMLLLAPALSLQKKALLVKFLAAIDIFGLRVPSFSLSRYRVHRWIPLSYYGALFDVVRKNTDRAGEENLRATPTMVLLSPDDMLVKSSGVRAWVEERHLGWDIREAHPDGELARQTFYHMLLDKISLGTAWAVLESSLPP